LRHTKTIMHGNNFLLCSNAWHTLQYEKQLVQLQYMLFVKIDKYCVIMLHQLWWNVPMIIYT